MHPRTIGVTLCWLPALLGAQTTLHLPQPPHELSATGRALTDLLKQRLDAVVAGSGTAYSRFVDSALVGFQDTAVVSLKSMAAEVAGNTSSRSVSFDVDHIGVSEHGDLAILTYDVTEHSHYGDQTLHYTSRSSNVYQSRGGQWYLVFLNEMSFPIAHAAIAADTSRYDSYVGKYDWGGGFGDVISRDGRRLLMVQTGDTTHHELFPEGENRFYVEGDPGAAVFTRDATGNVTGFIYHGPGGVTVIAHKVS